MQPNQFANAFSPVGSNTVAIAATSASAETTIDGGGNTMQIFNDSTTPVFCNWETTAGSAATTGGYPVAPGSVVVVAVVPGVVSVSAIRISGTGNVYFTKGFGL